ncbi:MAG TPA: ATP-binding protein [Pseudonocardiaceae bacterium]|jgi:signal transduction histidine kinase|nr:ATP-binding protein [Pseudonocardiaceae bacterium]
MVEAGTGALVRTLLGRGAAQGPAGDGSLARAWRYVVIGPVLYRVAAFPKVFIGYAGSNGTLGLAPTLSATVFSVAVNVAAVVFVVRRGGLRARWARPALLGDLAVGVVLNLVVAATAPAAVQPFAVDVAWTWLVGSIGLWTCVFGLPTAALLVVAAVPFRGLLTLVGGLPLGDHLAVSRSVGCLVALVVAVVTAAAILALLGAGAQFALHAGVVRGAQEERVRNSRAMHDGLLQTLDALAITPPGDAEDAVRRLADVRTVIKAEAAELRRRISSPVEAEGGRSLVADLADVATEMARHGLRTELVAADFDDQAVSEARRVAMCDAVREALRNTVKHAEASEVVLRVEERDGGIAVVARDHGVGFDAAVREPGFGISQSIVARLAEVGGRGAVDSQPGHGTRVTLWVPC